MITAPNTSKFVWMVLRQLRQVWVRAVGFAVLAIATVWLSQILGRFIPDSWVYGIGAEAVSTVLNILASSMLAVTTFSLAIATQAFAAAANTATPRATALLQRDKTAQNVLATFLGAFLFGLVGIIALQAGYYSDAGRLVLFAVTGLVVVLVVVAFLRWISHLMVFGRMADTLDRVEDAAREALSNRVAHPYLGGRPLRSGVPQSCVPVTARTVGFILHVDIRALDEAAREAGVKLWLAVLPGEFVHPAGTILHVDRDLDDNSLDELRDAFTIGPERDFDQDPRFGMVVLSEIASRALSPGINDPGTAISVIGRLISILTEWREDPGAKVEYEAVFVPPIRGEDLIRDAFAPIARDGAALIEVQSTLLKGLSALAAMAPEPFGTPAVQMAREALDHSHAQMRADDYERLAGTVDADL